MRIDGREQHYIEAKRRLDLASGRLTSLDAQIVDVAGAIARWRGSWRQTNDPRSAVARVLAQPWPDHGDLQQTFDEWLDAYDDALGAWGALPSEAKQRLVQPGRC